MANAEGYVTVGGEDKDLDASAPAGPEGQQAPIPVALRLERIAEELAMAQQSAGAPAPNAVGVGLKGVQDNAPGFTVRVGTRAGASAAMPSEDAPHALVMATGKTARSLMPVLGEAGLFSVAPVTGDRKLDAAPKLAHGTVSLADKLSAGLLANAQAVLQAAKACDARAVFLCDESAGLAGDGRFLARAKAQGLRVFTPADGAIVLGWSEPSLPDPEPELGDWRTCNACKLSFDSLEVAESAYGCPACGHPLRMDSDERIATILDEGSFIEWDEGLPAADPLGFEGYAGKLAAQREKSGHEEAVRCGQGSIGGIACAFGVMDSSFLMGSMGTVVGEKVSRLFDRATEARLPVIMLCASGGARMQEGLASLMQMAKTSCAVQRHDAAGLLYVSVLTDPTTGGVTASFATEADIILSEPETLIGFAGQRVIRDTIKQELPEGFQTAEFALEHGLIDAIVERACLREALGRLLALHEAPAGPTDALRGTQEPSPASVSGPFGAQAMAEGPVAKVTMSDTARAHARTLSVASRIPLIRNLVKPQDSLRDLERHAERELKRSGLSSESAPGSAWENVQIARNVHRPTALRYVEGLVDGFFELHGDRAFADDGAVVGGIGWIAGRPATVIAQEKGADLNERIRRNFGCPQPEGYRKAIRLMRQAEKFGRPIVCIVDTQGAFCGTGAEERGQGNAIAESLTTMASLEVPCVSVLVGEGGSGGALALALANRVAMLEHAVYSILSPEGFASILWKDGKRAPEAAEAMRMSAPEVLAMGIVDAVIPEGEGAAHENPEQAVANVRDYVLASLAELSEKGACELVEERQARFARF